MRTAIRMTVVSSTMHHRKKNEQTRVDSMTVQGDHDLGISLPVYGVHSDTLATFTTLKRTPAQNKEDITRQLKILR